MDYIVLKVENLSKEYPKFHLNNINFSLEQGTIMGFIGQNGSGKSTTLKSIMGIVTPDKGRVLVNNTSEGSFKEDIGYVGENLDFYQEVKLRKIYRFTSKFYKNWDEKLFLDIINKFNVDLDKKMSQLSKGMVVKFSLAIALAHHPRLLLLDEPTSGLDPVIRSDLLDIIKETAKKEKTAVLFSSHITEDIVKIADKVIFIDYGEIKLLEDKEKLTSNYVKINDIDKIQSLKDINIVLKTDKNAIVDLSNSLMNKSHLMNKKIDFEEVTLDSMLLYITKELN